MPAAAAHLRRLLPGAASACALIGSPGGSLSASVLRPRPLACRLGKAQQRSLASLPLPPPLPYKCRFFMAPDVASCLLRLATVVSCLEWRATERFCAALLILSATPDGLDLATCWHGVIRREVDLMSARVYDEGVIRVRFNFRQGPIDLVHRHGGRRVSPSSHSIPSRC